MPIVPPSLVAKLDPLIRRLASSHDGEALAAARALERRLRAKNYDLNDLAETIAPHLPAMAPQRAANSWRAMVGRCLAYEQLLRPREREFVTSLLNWRGQLTPKQNDWLTAIYERLRREGAT